MLSNMRCKNVITGLLMTLFVLTFALYALYKYSLIDPDAVLYKNFKFTSGQDDFGIDVSHLRGLRDGDAADDKREAPGGGSYVEDWDEIVRTDGGARVGYITDDCDKPTVVYGVSYLMKVADGVKVVVLVNYTAEREVGHGAGEAVIVGSFGKASLVNDVMDICSLDEELIECPVKKGFRAYRREVTLPKYAPKGKYQGTAYLRYTGTTKSRMCIRGTLIL